MLVVLRQGISAATLGDGMKATEFYKIQHRPQIKAITRHLSGLPRCDEDARIFRRFYPQPKQRRK